MLICHEGLPRSGKSFEAMVKHVLPAIKSGRKVYAYVEGLDHEKIAEVIEESVEKVKELLIQITREQVPQIYLHVEKNALIVIDELQNFWPNSRGKIPDEIMKFVAEHGHDGQDIIVMTQSFAGCHREWRNRTERKIQFLKLSALGKDDRYQWTSSTGVLDIKGNVQFQKMDSGFSKYDPKYFGIYKSHSSSDVQTAHYKDSRFNVFSQKSIKYGIPLFFCAAIYGAWYVYQDFKHPERMVKTVKKPESVKTTSQTVSSGQATVVQQADKATQEKIARLEAANEALNLKLKKYQEDPIEKMKPRHAGNPETAPAFDDIRQVNAMPYNVGCMMFSGDPMSCKCITSQGSQIDGVAVDRCIARATGAHEFNPYSGNNIGGRITSANIGETVKTGQVSIN